MGTQVYKCECGYVTHFAKALEAHCRFRHHKPFVEAEKPLMEKKEPAEQIPAEEPEVKAVKKTTRKPRTTKKAVKE